LWSDRLLAHLIANAPEFHFGQEVVHGNLQGLEYDLDDIHTLTIKIKKDIEFQRGIIVKAIILENFPSSLRIELYSSIWIFETNTL
jgi:hypothetical protein